MGGFQGAGFDVSFFRAGWPESNDLEFVGTEFVEGISLQ